jgi:hypothetical protein
MKFNVYDVVKFIDSTNSTFYNQNFSVVEIKNMIYKLYSLSLRHDTCYYIHQDNIKDNFQLVIAYTGNTLQLLPVKKILKVTI